MDTSTISRNGLRPGDVSYISLAVPDVGRAERFYARLLGWSFSPGRLGREQGDQVTPQVGLWDGVRPGRATERGPVLGYRVAEIAESVERVRALGGEADDPVARPYGLEAACTDNQGLVFFLHQLDDNPVDHGIDLTNGRRHGDVAYITLGVPRLAEAETFYGGLLGWTFSPGSSNAGRQIAGVTPMAGLWAGGHHGAVLAFRVDELAAAVEAVRALGGEAGAVERRPYGLAADNCADDQGVRFHLLQLG
ncbi:MAG: VOC family protein [Acidimicrobiales bacterium]